MTSSRRCPGAEFVAMNVKVRWRNDPVPSGCRAGTLAESAIDWLIMSGSTGATRIPVPKMYDGVRKI